MSRDKSLKSRKWTFKKNRSHPNQVKARERKLRCRQELKARAAARKMTVSALKFNQAQETKAIMAVLEAKKEQKKQPQQPS